MKILMYDCEMGRFSGVIKRIWEKQGHEVEMIRYYDPAHDEDHDVIWFEWSDSSSNLYSTRKFPKDGGGYNPLPELSGKTKTACRIIDIDMWAGNPGGTDWKNIQNAIFIAPHIQKIAEERFPQLKDTKVSMVKLGVELDKFPFVDKKERGKRIAWVGKDEPIKGIDRAVKLLIALNRRDKDWTLHCRIGEWGPSSYFSYYYRDLIRREGIEDKVEFITEPLEDMKPFYADKDYLLNTGLKEAFSYATAEGMATGLKPIIHRFYGADGIWPSKYIYTLDEEAIDMFLNDDYDRKEYRDYAEKELDAERMVKAYNDIVGIS